MKKRAFTLIELLVVVLIIGILAAIALPQYQVAVEKARAAEAIINIQTWHKALQRYHLANGTWPATMESALQDIDIQLPTPRYGWFFYNPSIYTISYYGGGEQYTISRSVEPSFWTFSRGLVCMVHEANTTTNFAAKVCKNLCGTSTLSGEEGERYWCTIP